MFYNGALSVFCTVFALSQSESELQFWQVVGYALLAVHLAYTVATALMFKYKWWPAM